MRPLLKIQSIPIKIEAQTRRASFQNSTEPVPISKPASSSGTLNKSAGRPVSATPVKITGAPANPAAQQSEKAAQQRQTEYTTRNTDQQSAYPNAVQGDASTVPVTDTVIGKALMADYVPSQPAPQAAAPTTSVDYQMDRPTFDWNTNSKPQLEFVPAQIEYTITQYPQLIIEYVGEPIYVPASANPNYKGTA